MKPAAALVGELESAFATHRFVTPLPHANADPAFDLELALGQRTWHDLHPFLNFLLKLEQVADAGR